MAGCQQLAASSSWLPVAGCLQELAASSWLPAVRCGVVWFPMLWQGKSAQELFMYSHIPMLADHKQAKLLYFDTCVFAVAGLR